MQNQKNTEQKDYRLWSNVLDINEQISTIERKIEQCHDQIQRLNLRQELGRLLSKRYDQIQFNKEISRNET
jgi:hypothetical protein